MALKLVRQKKKLATSRKSQKKSAVEKFADAIDVQLRLAAGDTVKQGRGTAMSWVVDGAAYGEKFILLPTIGKTPLWPKAAMPLKSDSVKDVTAVFNALKAEVTDGKMNNRIYAVIRSQKKKVAKKQRLWRDNEVLISLHIDCFGNAGQFTNISVKPGTIVFWVNWCVGKLVSRGFIGSIISCVATFNIASAGSVHHHYSEGNPHGVPVTVDGCVKIYRIITLDIQEGRINLENTFHLQNFTQGQTLVDITQFHKFKGRVSSITKPGVNSELSIRPTKKIDYFGLRGKSNPNGKRTSFRVGLFHFGTYCVKVGQKVELGQLIGKANRLDHIHMMVMVGPYGIVNSHYFWPKGLGGVEQYVSGRNYPEKITTTNNVEVPYMVAPTAPCYSSGSTNRPDEQTQTNQQLTPDIMRLDR